MILDKNTFNYIKEMINNKESVTCLMAFCKGFGMDLKGCSSPVIILEDKIIVTYRRINYYVGYNHSKIYGTTYFNSIK